MKTEKPETYILTASKPQVLWIPPNTYNGFKTLTDNAQVIFFSTVTIEETKDDDYRLPADEYYGFFDVEER